VILGVIFLLSGLVLLSWAADKFVDHAVNVAVATRISPVVVGAVIVGFGTSAPELLVSGLAAGQGDIDVGIGNIMGSNMANITLVLGAAALLTPVAVGARTLRREAPIALVSVLGFAVLLTNDLSTSDGYLLLGGLAVFLFVSIRGGRDGRSAVEIETLEGDRPLRFEISWMVVGLTGTVIGAQLMVTGAVRVADGLGVSGGFVGLTIVALGTSLPELVTAVSASRKGQTELVVGNLLGSNVFNSLGVGGAVAILGSGAAADEELIGLPVVAMCVAMIGAWAMMLGGRELKRQEGLVLLIGYLASLPFLPR
jgi:cation:H+ antiporter